jgi:hypothetical protein
MPTDRTEVVQSEHGPYFSYRFTVKAEGSVFVIGWVDYDPSFDFNRSIELDLNRDIFIKETKATLLNSKNLLIDGFQCLEFTAETTDSVFKSRVYMVGRRPYQLVTRTKKGLDDSANVSRFFDSFKVRVR